MWENKNSGYSLIEIVVSLGILAVISYGVVGTCTRQHGATAQHSARSAAQKDVDQLLNTIKRDMKFLVNGGFTITGQGTGVQIQRISPNQNNPAITYSVLFQSVCMALGPDQDSYHKAYSAAFRQALYSAPQ